MTNNLDLCHPGEVILFCNNFRAATISLIRKRIVIEIM